MKASVVALALVLSSAVAAPAFAVMEPAVSVGLLPVPTLASVDANFTGDIIAFTARGNADVACRSISATFADGSTAFLYRGTLAPDDQVKMWLPGGARNVRHMDFDCYSVDRGRAFINVAANMAPTYVVPIG